MNRLVIASILLLFLACSKKDNKIAKPVVFNYFNVHGKPYASQPIVVNQFNIISANLTNATYYTKYSWTMTPDEDELVAGNDSLINWLPVNEGDYTLALTVTDEAGGTTNHQATFEVTKGDFRFQRWNDFMLSAFGNEAFYGSFEQEWSNERFLFSIEQDQFSNGRQDIPAIGDYIVYYVDEDLRIIRGDIIIKNNNANDPSLYKSEYENAKSRLNEYTALSEEQIWDETTIAQEYKANPDSLGSAIKEGYVKFESKYKSETSNIVLTMEKDSSAVDIIIHYSPL